jgi:hypothetical protein
MTLDILWMDVTKELLRKMAKEERALFLALCHASNQVNALWKLVIILTNGDADDQVKRVADKHEVVGGVREFEGPDRISARTLGRVGHDVSDVGLVCIRGPGDLLADQPVY